jgi:NAD(P)-dependent dehydrogenase (short-subunit alcohol dehydrogenase family)
VALVTGGGRGRGRFTVEVLAGVRAYALQLDVGGSKAFPGFVTAVSEVLTGWGASHIDFLVNNAGISHHAAIGKVTEEDFDALYRVHLKGVLFLTQALLPIMADGGRIVNVSSALTRVVYPGSAAYALMKGGVEVHRSATIP